MNAPLGARLRDDGCDFRVWAPHATAVNVLLQAGDHWDDTVNSKVVKLEKSNDEYWTGFAKAVDAGHLYRYEITNNGTFQRLDAAARDTIHSELTRSNPSSQNASIVVTNEPYSWSPFETPRFSNFLVYQLHCGTFAGRNDHLEVEYKYEVAGRNFTSDRVDFVIGDVSAMSIEGEDYVRDFPAGSRTVCYVNPENPTVAVLLPGRSAPVFWMAAVSGLLLLIGSSPMLIFGGGLLLWTVLGWVAARQVKSKTNHR